MKKSLITLGTSVCVLLTFPSCQSTPKMANGGYEEATMASDTIADGEIPPWLLEDDSTSPIQIDAGSYTQPRNAFATPEPTETIADHRSGTISTSQNQPRDIAQNEVFVEKPETDIPTFTPPSTEYTHTTPLVVNTPSATSKLKQNAAQTKQPKKRGSKTGKTSSKNNSRKYEQPTMLTYKVRPGDNLSDIAKRSRTTVAQIKKDSGLKGDTIYPGQTIKVKYIPKDYKPGKSSNKGGSATNTKAPKGQNHIVAKGETISGIAKRYGIPYTDILKANNLSASDAVKIRPGKRISIPSKSTGKSSNKKKSSKNSKRKR